MNFHEKPKKILKITGGILLGIGVIFAIIGLTDIFGVLNNGVATPNKFWCVFLGLPLCVAGGVSLTFGFRREMLRYRKNEAIPVINEASEEMKPAFQNISSAVKQDTDGKTNVCKTCGAANDGEAKFCKTCGKTLTVTCPMCGETNTRDSKFCDNCGENL